MIRQLRRNLRGQVALEYLTTYGFALLVLLTTLGVLTYLGVFNVNAVRASECSFPTGAKCADYRLINGQQIGVNLTNEYGVNLTVVRANITLDQDTTATVSTCGLFPASGAWVLGQNVSLVCSPPGSVGAIRSGQRYDIVFQIAFTQQGGSYEHTIRGVLGATAK